jgi:nicotinamide-nucleotide amidase
MKAEIITIGDEILIGQIVDSNSAFIAKELNEIGISVVQISSISDEPSSILAALKEAQSRAELVITTGGLGPTKDDLTKQTLCEYFKDELVENKALLKHIEELFDKYVETPINEYNRSQRFQPSKAELLFNSHGTAPGMWLANEKGVVVSMPGVPFEMKAMLREQLFPKIVERFNRPFIIHKTLVTYGPGETAIAEHIEEFEKGLDPSIKLAYLPNLGKVRLRLTAKGTDKATLELRIEESYNQLKELLKGFLVSLGDDVDIELEIARMLTEKQMSLAIAESFTGGSISARFTNNPGASAYFKGSVVAYATSVKEEVLGVSKQLINEHSVVSSQVVEAMAIGVKDRLASDFAIATTGNAGPSKGDSDQEVGNVYIAIASPSGVFSKNYSMGKNRERTVEKGVNRSLSLLFEEISKF